jgi:tRNA threonylcarbamoyladenosine biosynthesis protein TsaE
MDYTVKSNDSNTTEQFGEQIGHNLKGGEVIELVSDLGGGKTTFVRGLTHGMGSKDHVASPTFTITRQYYSPKLTLQHFDFYRLHDPSLVKHELAEFINYPNQVVVIEWAEAVKDVLPDSRLTIEIKSVGENERLLIFNCAKALSYLLEGLDHADTNY